MKASRFALALLLAGAAVTASAQPAASGVRVAGAVEPSKRGDPAEPFLDEQYYETVLKKSNQRQTCAVGETLCGPTCVNLATDANQCGACATLAAPTACEPGFVCLNGVCACPVGTFECNGACQAGPCTGTCGAAGQPDAFNLYGNCVQGVMECFNALSYSGSWLQDAQYTTYSMLIKVDGNAPSFGVWLEASRAAKFDFSTVDGTPLHSVWVAIGNTCPPDCPGCLAPQAPALAPGFFYSFPKPLLHNYLRVDVSAPCTGIDGSGTWSITPICNGADVAPTPPVPAASAMGSTPSKHISPLVKVITAQRAQAATS